MEGLVIDAADTFADASELVTDVGYQPNAPVEEGVRQFAEWYREYYAVQGN